MTIAVAFAGSMRCAVCGLVPATIVDGEAIGLQEEPPRPKREAAPAAPATRSGRLTKSELEGRVRELASGLRRLRKG